MPLEWPPTVGTRLVAPVSHFGQMRRDRVEAGKLEIGGAEQPGCEQPPAFPTTGTGDAPLSADEKYAEVCGVAPLDPQSLQLGTHPRQKADIQGPPNCSSGRVAAPLRGLRNSGVGDFLSLVRLV